MARTFSAADEEQLRQLHADGLSRNEIARQMEWSVGTVTNHAQRSGSPSSSTGAGVATLPPSDPSSAPLTSAAKALTAEHHARENLASPLRLYRRAEQGHPAGRTIHHTLH